MKEGVEKKISELTAKAKRLNGMRIKSSSSVRNGSSLHKVIKTREQANVFMKLLQSS